MTYQKAKSWSEYLHDLWKGLNVIEGCRVLAIIPARGGSKGIPRKNLQEVAGRSLVSHAFEAGKNSNYIDRLILSSEDDEIIEHALSLGLEVPFRRPKELARDESSGMDPVFHAIGNCPGFDLVVLLQVTSPLRRTSDIDTAIEVLMKNGSDSCVSVCSVDKTPHLMFRADSQGCLEPFLNEFRPQRRQDMEPLYLLNGAVYVGRTTAILQHRSFITPKTSYVLMEKARSLDIDTPDELDYCRWLMSRKDFSKEQI